MSDMTAQSVVEINGIGEVTAARLNSHGLFSIADLLRVSVGRLQSIVAELASDEESYHWQRQAELLQISGVTVELAVAMIAAGLDSIERVALAEITILQDELSDSLLTLSGEFDLIEIARSAVKLHYSGVLRGCLKNEDGSPIAGAQVRIGYLRETTDARGRFNFYSIHPATPRSMFVEQLDGSLYRFTDVDFVFDHRIVVNREFALGSEILIPSEQDEYEGDVIENAHTLEMTSKLHSSDDIREGDILTVQRFYADGEHAKLFSQFRKSVQGKLVVRTHKIPLTSLSDGDTSKGARYLVRGQELVPITTGQHSLEIRRKFKRVYKSNPELSESIESADDLIAFIERYNAQG
ncbi:MAG: helix-hairpin-helix domain-containing protein [Pseudomonadota bacterium]